MPQEFSNIRVTVMGLGRFGGGIVAVRWLARQGADVLVTDLCSEEHLAGSLADVSDLIHNGTVSLRLGGHDEYDFTTPDLVIANPAVPKPWQNRYLLAAREAGVPVSTEIRLLAERLDRARVIGVTGTAGKSTTTAMIHHLLTRAGHRSHLGGNIGGSLLNTLDHMRAEPWVVLELSSAMLYWLGRDAGYDGAPGFSPHIALLTNIEPNHLDWHGSMQHYEHSKRNIFASQEEGDFQITEDRLHITGEIPLNIPGAHNQLNARFALAAMQCAVGLDPHDAAPLLADFPGLPHRLQLVAERDGMRFYDDSKCTTPRAAVLAVHAFDPPSRIHLIAGGYDKGSDLSPIAQLTAEIAGLYTIGTTGPTLAQLADDSAKAVFCKTLDSAVRNALARMKRGDILLLSPGCASWDQFDNFEQRGEQFAGLVRGNR